MWEDNINLLRTAGIVVVVHRKAGAKNKISVIRLRPVDYEFEEEEERAAEWNLTDKRG